MFSGLKKILIVGLLSFFATFALAQPENPAETLVDSWTPIVQQYPNLGLPANATPQQVLGVLLANSIISESTYNGMIAALSDTSATMSTDLALTYMCETGGGDCDDPEQGLADLGYDDLPSFTNGQQISENNINKLIADGAGKVDPGGDDGTPS